MSLGYRKGNAWVVDKVFEHYASWDTYMFLLPACRAAGYMFSCEFSYSSRLYCTSIHTWDQTPSGTRILVERANAYDANPIFSIVKALKTHNEMTPLIRVLCIELECRLIAEKLLPLRALEDAIEGLTKTLSKGTLR